MEQKENILKEWVLSLPGSGLPAWEELPKLDLYMDQIITVMENYLEMYKITEDKLITPSIINNYVKLGVMPKPIKKRYGRIHLAYLIMVCILKQILSISMIQKILPGTLTEAETEKAYKLFTQAHEKVTQKASEMALEYKNSFGIKNATGTDIFALSVQIALTGNLQRIFAELIAEESSHHQ